MLDNNPTWQAVKDWGTRIARITQLETIGIGVLLPLGIGVFSNLWTGAKPGEGAVFGIALLVIAALQIWLVVLQITRQSMNPLQHAAAVLELEEKLEETNREAEQSLKAANERGDKIIMDLRNELRRKSEAHDMIRAVLDAFNLQTCQIDPAAPDAFSRGLMPIIHKVACAAPRTLGLSSQHYTIEVYCLDPSCSESTIQNPISNERIEHPSYAGHVEPALFYSSSGLDPLNLNLMAAGSAFDWGWARRVPGVCCIDSDRHLFYENDRPRPNLYFHQCAAVPVNMVCTPDCIGILAITSMQQEPFHQEILDTMQFLASVISQYISAHSRCVSEWKDKQAKEARKRKRLEMKSLKDEQSLEDMSETPAVVAARTDDTASPS